MKKIGSAAIFRSLQSDNYHSYQSKFLTNKQSCRTIQNVPLAKKKNSIEKKTS